MRSTGSWRIKVDWTKYQVSARAGLEHCFQSEEDVRDYLRYAARSPVRQALFHVIYNGLVLAGAYQQLDKRIHKILRQVAMKESEKKKELAGKELAVKVDEKAAYALWAVLNGDSTAVAALLEVPVATIQQLAEQRGWRLPSKRRASREVALNKGMNFLLSHRLRATLFRLIEGLNALRTDELFKLLFAGYQNRNSKLRIQDLESLARTIMMVHRVTEESLEEIDSDDASEGVTSAFLASPRAKKLLSAPDNAKKGVNGPEKAVENAENAPEDLENGQDDVEKPDLSPSEAVLGREIERSVAEFFKEALETDHGVAENLRKIISTDAKDAPVIETTTSQIGNDAQKDASEHKNDGPHVDFRSDTPLNRPIATVMKVTSSDPPVDPVELSSVDPSVGAIPISPEKVSLWIETIAEKD